MQTFGQILALTLIVFVAACSGGEQRAEQSISIKSKTTEQSTQLTQSNSQNTTASTATPAAREGQKFIAGKDYKLLPQPLDVEVTDGVEVREIFWFGCSHCNATQPYVHRWLESKPASAKLVRMPAPLSGLWSLHAQIFYTNQAMGLEEKLNQATFDAIHKTHLRLTSVDQFADFYSKNFGVDAEEYKTTFKSFNVSIKMKKATQDIQQAQVNGVPTFIVAGKYLVNGESAGSTPRIFSVINYLVAEESKS